MSQRTRHLSYVIPLLSGALLFGIMNMTDPLSGGPVVILLVFILLYVLLAGILFIVLHFGVRALSKVWSQKSVNVREWRIGVRRAYYIASILAFGPVLLLAMQSVGQLQLRDVALVIVLLGLGVFYVVKRS